MNKHRLEAFSDGVIAIIITIMVLDFKVPFHANHFSDLIALLPMFLSYILSFTLIAIYWNNHHHLFLAVENINGRVLWANMHLLFWLSLIPFVTFWLGESGFAKEPVMLYGCVLLLASIAFYILNKSLLHSHDKNSKFAKALGNHKKEISSIVLYILAIVSSLISSYVALGLYSIVALIWIIPDKRVEKNC